MSVFTEPAKPPHNSSGFATAPASTAWPRVVVVLAAGIVAAFQVGKAAAALPLLRAELGLGLGVAGWVLSMFNVIGLACGAATGVIVARFGDRRMVLAGLA